MSEEPIPPGGRYGLSNAGWPPATIVRDEEGLYFLQRLSDDLKRTIREEITSQDAMDWIESDED